MVSNAADRSSTTSTIAQPASAASDMSNPAFFTIGVIWAHLNADGKTPSENDKLARRAIMGKKYCYTPSSTS